MVAESSLYEAEKGEVTQRRFVSREGALYERKRE